MSARCDWTLTLNSRPEDMDGILSFLNTRDPGAFCRCGNQLFTENSSAKNIWGSVYLSPDADLYIELAHAVPEAAWFVRSTAVYEGGGGRDHAWLEVSYAKGLLDFSRLAYANCELPGEYWDLGQYRLYDPVTKTRETTLLSWRDGENWNAVYDDYWEPGRMEDLSFCFLGEPKRFSGWDQAEAIVEKAGGQVLHEISSDLRYLVCDDPDRQGISRQDLKEHYVRLLTEDQFIKGYVDPWTTGRIPEKPLLSEYAAHILENYPLPEDQKA